MNFIKNSNSRNFHQTEWNTKVTLKAGLFITQQVQKEEHMDKLEED